MSRKSLIPVVALAALLAVSLAHAQGSTSGSASGTASATASTPGKAPVKASATKTTAAKHHYAKVDINSASKEELMKLPGVGDATAEKIIADRPFKSKSELRTKGIVTKKEYASIAMKVIAKQEPTANASSK